MRIASLVTLVLALNTTDCIAADAIPRTQISQLLNNADAGVFTQVPPHMVIDWGGALSPRIRGITAFYNDHVEVFIWRAEAEVTRHTYPFAPELSNHYRSAVDQFPDETIGKLIIDGGHYDIHLCNKDADQIIITKSVKVYDNRRSPRDIATIIDISRTLMNITEENGIAAD